MRESLQFFHIRCTWTDSSSESTSIPVNPRTERPVGYAFVDLVSADDAEKAIAALSGQEVLERKVSVQLARKPEAGEGATGEGKDGEGRKRGSTRGRARGRGRGGRNEAGRAVSILALFPESADCFRLVKPKGEPTPNL